MLEIREKRLLPNEEKNGIIVYPNFALARIPLTVDDVNQLPIDVHIRLTSDSTFNDTETDRYRLVNRMVIKEETHDFYVNISSKEVSDLLSFKFVKTSFISSLIKLVLGDNMVEPIIGQLTYDEIVTEEGINIKNFFKAISAIKYIKIGYDFIKPNVGQFGDKLFEIVEGFNVSIHAGMVIVAQGRTDEVHRNLNNFIECYNGNENILVKDVDTLFKVYKSIINSKAISEYKVFMLKNDDGKLELGLIEACLIVLRHKRNDDDFLKEGKEFIKILNDNKINTDSSKGTHVFGNEKDFPLNCLLKRM